MFEHFAVYNVYLRYAIAVEKAVKLHELPNLINPSLNKIQITD